MRGISLQKPVFEQFKKGGIGKIAVRLIERRRNVWAVHDADERFVVLHHREQPGGFFDLAKFVFQALAKPGRGAESPEFPARVLAVQVDESGAKSAKFVRPLVVAVEMRLIKNIERNQHAASQSDCEAERVDAGENR